MAPYFYNYLDVHNSQVMPNVFHSENTTLTKYYERYLLQKVMSVIHFKNLPETWNKNYFYYVLLCNGYISIIDTPTYGVIPQHCTLNGRNIFYQPSKVIVNNPLLDGTIEATIDEDAALIKLQPDYGSILDIISYYANLMSITSESAGINIINSKLAMVFAAENKSSAESFKKMYDKLSSGEPAVFIDSKLMGLEGEPAWQTFIQNLSQNYIGDKLLADLKKIENEFCSMIGIPNSNFEKNAHLLEAEVNANNGDTQMLVSLWIDTLNDGCESANRLFNLDIHASAMFEEEMHNAAYLEENEEADDEESRRE